MFDFFGQSRKNFEAMRRFLLWIAGLIVLIPFGFIAGQTAWMQLNPAAPGAAALAALESSNAVEVSYTDPWLRFAPRGGLPTTGLILYPGANCDVRGYAPLLRALAEAGYLGIGIQMPLRLALLRPEAAADVPPVFPQVRNWIAVGHSMGGGVISRYAQDFPERLAGVILLDAYPLEGSTLANSPLPVWHIHRARLDGLPPDKHRARRHRFPAHAIWVPIPGGSHMQFGSFVGGIYKEDWEAQISEADQLRQIQAAVLRAVRAIAPPSDVQSGGAA